MPNPILPETSSRRSKGPTPKKNALPPSPKRKPTSVADAAKLVAKIKFLVPGFVPFGMVTGVIAQPGHGKSALILGGIVKPILTGAPWFTQENCNTRGRVLWCPTENDMAITIDRMTKWKVPMDTLLLPFDDPLASVNLMSDDDLKRIERRVTEYGIPLVVIDSLRGAHADDENNSRVGQVLKSLAAIAERTGAAVIVVHHTRKLMEDEELSANSSRGSNAILALMRSQIGIDRPDPQSKWCRLRVLKENLGIAPPPVGFCVTERGLEYGPAPDKPRRGPKDAAEDWLRNFMKPGKTYVAGDIIEVGKDSGHDERTLRRAAVERLKIKPVAVRKGGKISHFTWTLP